LQMRTPREVLHDSLQEWSEEEFMELRWNLRAADAAVKALEKEGYEIKPRNAVCAGCEDKLIERLQAADISGHGEYSALAREAANEIKRLRVEVSELRKRRH
jgi:hypothetical protein